MTEKPVYRRWWFVASFSFAAVVFLLISIAGNVEDVALDYIEGMEVLEYQENAIFNPQLNRQEVTINVSLLMSDAFSPDEILEVSRRIVTSSDPTATMIYQFFYDRGVFADPAGEPPYTLIHGPDGSLGLWNHWYRGERFSTLTSGSDSEREVRFR
jgi:hypothetical protein